MFDPFTLVGIHTWLSLIAIAVGIVVVAGLLGDGASPAMTTLFLATAMLTSATGFILPADRFLPSHATGIVALIVLAIALAALYAFRLAGAWRATYAVAMVASLYFLVFVAVFQSFLKVPALNRLAPTGSEPPFLVAQVVTLAVFVFLGFAAVKASRRSALAPL
jgi:hypothetical protein